MKKQYDVQLQVLGRTFRVSAIPAENEEMAKEKALAFIKGKIFVSGVSQRHTPKTKVVDTFLGKMEVAEGSDVGGMFQYMSDIMNGKK